MTGKVMAWCPCLISSNIFKLLLDMKEECELWILLGSKLIHSFYYLIPQINYQSDTFQRLFGRWKFLLSWTARNQSNIFPNAFWKLTTLLKFKILICTAILNRIDTIDLLQVYSPNRALSTNMFVICYHISESHSHLYLHYSVTCRLWG